MDFDLRQGLIDQLRSWSRTGLNSLPKPQDNPAIQSLVQQFAATTAEADDLPGQAPTESSSSGAPAQARLLDSATVDSYGPSLPPDERSELFRVLSSTVAQCTRCPDLVRSRSQTVFGVGNLQPRVVFFGEAPGADEDRLGEPFVGAAGQLLNKIIAASQMKREEVYILNAVKCRPRGNRTPTDEEIGNCRGFMEQQLEVLQPEFICCLGAVAARSLLRQTQSISRMRQQFYRYRNSRVLVTYHPSYLLREPSAKRLVWEDMQMLMREMGLAPPGSKS